MECTQVEPAIKNCEKKNKDESQLPHIKNDRKKQNKLTKPPRPRKNEPGFHKVMFEETSYYFKKGLRYVYPYLFTFTAHVKGRWLNLTVLELFGKEFHMETMEYYEKAINIGKIRVDDKIVSSDHILKNNEVLTTQVHRHEPPVVREEIEFVENSTDMVVINKPSSIPVHPCGRYRHNTIVFILGKEYGLEKLHTIHRIDRLTSGILMFSKVPEKAREMEKAVHGRQVEKEYFARVAGEFPSEEVKVDEPIQTTSHKIGVCQVHADGKPCSTVFQRISYNGKSSVVSCKPHTGRMHQIRVHLQWLGFPIINDPIYNHATAWGLGKGKKGTEIDAKKVIGELIRTRKDNSYGDEINTNKPEKVNSTDINSAIESKQSAFTETHIKNTTEEIIDDAENNRLCSPDLKRRKLVSSNNQIKNDSMCDSSDTNSITESPLCTGKANNSQGCAKKEEERVCYMSRDLGEEYYDEDCTECKKKWKEPFQSELVMYLHAYLYKGPGWSYKTSKPKWAEDGWNEE